MLSVNEPIMLKCSILNPKHTLLKVRTAMEFNVTLEFFEAHWDCTSRMYLPAPPLDYDCICRR